jgi:hypothetical protein
MEVSKSQPEPKQEELSSTGIDFLTHFTRKRNTSVFLISCVSTPSFCPLLLPFSQSLTFNSPRGPVIFAFSLLEKAVPYPTQPQYETEIRLDYKPVETGTRHQLH